MAAGGGTEGGARRDAELVLVTGAHGFIARRLVRRLLAQGRGVRGLVRRDEAIEGVELVVGDVADEGAVRRAVAGVDAVVHTAASFEFDFAAARRVNVEGTALLAEAALRQGCRRFVHLSTCGAYDLVDVDVVDESTRLWPYDETSPLVYGVTKAEGDRVVARAVEAGLPAVVLRFPNVLGAGVDNFFTYGLPLAIRDGKVTVGGDGSNTWPVVHVEDLVEAVLLALHHPRAVGGTFTIVDHHTTWGEFAGRMAAWLGVELAQRERRAPYDMFEGRFSSEKVRTELGYAPRFTYEDAMLETRRFLQEQGVLD